ncbi:hypothetical protein ABIC71_004250 [Herbaspirillum seropedicae]
MAAKYADGGLAEQPQSLCGETLPVIESAHFLHMGTEDPAPGISGFFVQQIAETILDTRARGPGVKWYGGKPRWRDIREHGQ